MSESWRTSSQKGLIPSDETKRCCLSCKQAKEVYDSELEKF